MKKLRLLLLGLLTPLLCGVSFGFDLTSDEITYLNNNSLNQGSFTDQALYTLYYNPDQITYDNLCVIFSWLVRNYTSSSYNIYGSTTSTWAPNEWSIHDAFAHYHLYCLPYWNFKYLKLSYANAYKNETFTTNYFWVLDANKIINWYLGFDVQGLLNNYNQCSTDLNQCDTSVQQCLIDKESLSWSLATCNSDKESLTNYNEALSTQLNECLNNQSTWSNLSWLILNNNSLFRYLDDSLLSLPINNNLFLPLGYQGALDSWNVLYIKAIDEEEPIPYYIAEEDKISIIDILSYLFIFLLWVGVIFSLIKLFRKLFTH